MKNLLLLLVAVVATAGMSADAVAGGGGAKKDATIKVTNNATVARAVAGAIGAIVDVDPSTLADGSEATFLAAGGQILQAGKAGTFKVAAGTHKVYVVYDLVTPADLVVKTYTVGKGKTLNVHVNDAGLTP